MESIYCFLCGLAAFESTPQSPNFSPRSFFSVWNVFLFSSSDLSLLFFFSGKRKIFKLWRGSQWLRLHVRRALYHSIPNDTALHCRHCSRHSPSQNTQGKIVSTHQLSFFLYYTVKFLCFPVALHISSFLCVVNTLTWISIPACVRLNKSCVYN